jgi:CRISPR-associated protein Cas2
MLVLITYDVSTEKADGKRRLVRVAKICSNYGQRVQNSVFECDVDAALYVVIKKQLLNIISQDEDSLRFYNLGNKYQNRIEHFGVKATYDPEDVIIV